MKRLATAFLSLSLGLVFGAASAKAEICLDVCPAMILPDVPKAVLPLTGWIVPVFANQQVEILELPQFGTWDPNAETYTPGPSFWNVGIDRMKIHVSGNQAGDRTILFQTVEPVIDNQTQIYDPAITLTYQSGAQGLLLDSYARADGSILTNGVATVGGYISTTAVPPPHNDPDGTALTAVIELGDFAHVEMVNGAQGLGFRAIVDRADLECGLHCGTATLAVTPDEVYEITLTLGFDTALVPSATDLTLRLEVCEPGGVACQTTDIPGLAPVDLRNIVALDVGILGGTTAQASLTVDNVKLWRASLPGDAPLAVFDGFQTGLQSFWGVLGSISAANVLMPGVADTWAVEADLRSMDPNTKAWISDARPTGQKRFRMMLDLDLSQLNLGESEYLLPFHGHGTPVNGLGKSFDLFVRKLNGVYLMRGRVVTDAAAVVTTVFIPLSATKTNRIAVDFDAPIDTSTTGSFDISVNGVLYSLRGIDNDQRHIESVNFGASGFSGSTGAAIQERWLRLDNVTMIY